MEIGRRNKCKTRNDAQNVLLEGRLPDARQHPLGEKTHSHRATTLEVLCNLT